ncbi:MAG: hypothetical protein WBL61_10565 [Bryobacteraceae bacterium]
MRLVRLVAFVFVCAAALAAAPSITAVYNGASWVPPDLPNSGIAQGSIFTVIGTGLGPSALQQVQSYPLPTTQGLAGTTIQVTVGGVTENCPMIYTYSTAVAAILPSATPLGTGTLTLSYKGATGSIAIQVLSANFGTFTLNEGGTGPGVVTDANYIPITMIHPAQPGQGLILWGTGLGAVTGDETEPPVEAELNTGVQVFVQGQPAKVFYDGRSSSPGLDQINFYVPSGISGGCKTSVAVLVKGVTGNVTTISVAPAGQTTCGDTYGTLTAANLQKAVANGSLSMGGIELSRVNGGDDALIGYFGSYPLNSLIRSYGGNFGPSIGSCMAYEIGGTSFDDALIDPVQPTFLDAGPDLVVTGPGGIKTITPDSKGYYAAYLATEPFTYIEPGSYTVANGSGGAGVGPFNWGLTLPAEVVPTNIPASINRAQDLTLTWTGGSGFPLASIILGNGVLVNPATSLSSWVYAVCSADSSSGSFTIPAAILNLFPTNGYGTLTKQGLSISIAGIPEARFTVAGSPGLDTGILAVFVSTGSVPTIQ